MKLVRLILILGLLLPSLTHSQEATPQSRDNLTEEQRAELFKKPGKDEPVFPFEDLISKPMKTNEGVFSDVLNMLSTLGMIVGFILIVAWLLRRLLNTRIEQMNENSAIRILERRQISAKSIVYLIEVGNRHLVLAESHQGIVKVTEYPDDTPNKKTIE